MVMPATDTPLLPYSMLPILTSLSLSVNGDVTVVSPIETLFTAVFNVASPDEFTVARRWERHCCASYR